MERRWKKEKTNAKSEGFKSKEVSKLASMMTSTSASRFGLVRRSVKASMMTKGGKGRKGNTKFKIRLIFFLN